MMSITVQYMNIFKQRANGESESSKERHLLDGHSNGRKPDYRILADIDDANRELIFGEIKPPYCNITVNQRIIKLSELMKGSLDCLISVYGYWLVQKRMVF
ncbi:hypothetical protein RclHR1_08810008 [Rhizophagus clarus]|nr:hypothetical protein RclHR1_08810008 [Rhizophagus clarus]